MKSNPILRNGHSKTMDAYESAVMRLDGVINKATFLITLTTVAALYIWFTGVTAPYLILGAGFIGGITLVLVVSFYPATSPYLSPVYAILKGLVLGTIALFFDKFFPGLAVSAIAATFGVFFSMLLLYRAQWFRVTNGFMQGVFAATVGVAVFYFSLMLLSWIGLDMSIFTKPSWLTLGISVITAGIAAFSLLVDFEMISRGVSGNQPKVMEWYYSLGLLVTLVWLYLEIIELLWTLFSLFGDD